MQWLSSLHICVFCLPYAFLHADRASTLFQRVARFRRHLIGADPRSLKGDKYHAGSRGPLRTATCTAQSCSGPMQAVRSEGRQYKPSVYKTSKVYFVRFSNPNHTHLEQPACLVELENKIWGNIGIRISDESLSSSWWLTVDASSCGLIAVDG